MAIRHPIANLMTPPFGDTTFTKVFVGGLAWETQSEALGRHFLQYGEIFEAAVISDKNTGRSKGYGFVTFHDPESAKRACVDPSPIIDGRRANCNLASLGRPQSALPYAHLRPAEYYIGGLPVPRGIYGGNSTYHEAVPYGYQQGFVYPPYGSMAYRPEYLHPQNIFNPYLGLGQQYVQVYGVPGSANTAVYSYEQPGQPVPSGHTYTSVQGYTVPGHHMVRFTGPNVNRVTVTALPPVQAPYPAGVASPAQAQPQFVVPGHLPKFAQGGNSDQTAD